MANLVIAKEVVDILNQHNQSPNKQFEVYEYTETGSTGIYNRWAIKFGDDSLYGDT